MLNKPYTPPVSDARSLVLEFLRGGVHTWAELRAVTAFNDDYLGVVLSELLAQRQVRTECRAEARFYRLAPGQRAAC